MRLTHGLNTVPEVPLHTVVNNDDGILNRATIVMVTLVQNPTKMQTSNQYRKPIGNADNKHPSPHKKDANRSKKEKLVEEYQVKHILCHGQMMAGMHYVAS